MNFITGVPASGKTTRLLQIAKHALAQDKRVWWVGLPTQRSDIYRRATAQGALLGLEFLSSQQVYYRLLAAAQALKPLLVGTGRIAYVGEALKILENDLPSPGEARLFSMAIAEAKRFGHDAVSLARALTPAPSGKPDSKPNNEPDSEMDSEAARLVQVFKQYEQVKGERWDYDDFRTAALNLALAGDISPEANVLIVDGFRELGPLEWQLYRELDRFFEVYLSLPELPANVPANVVVADSDTVEHLTHTPFESPPAKLERYRAANPVSEARWLLRSLKRDLAEGLDALDIAVIMPANEIAAFAALADEYGVPLMDETPKALSDTPLGSLLLNILELPEYPTASRLLAIPELSKLANEALNRNVAGREALTSLAREIGVHDLWQRWLARLDVPADELTWAQDIVATLPSMLGVPAQPRLQDHFLARAKEAAILAKGASFRAWWAALLQETVIFERPKGGIALLTAKLASGRRFRKVYVAHAVEGAYSTGEREDYFVREEARVPPAHLFAHSAAGSALPKRFVGRDQLLFQELLTRADTVIITYPEADQGGPLAPEDDLITGFLGATEPIRRLPTLPLGSRLELANSERYHAPLEPLNLGAVSVENLARYDACAFRYWATKRLRPDREDPWWRTLIRRLREYGTLNDVRLASLQDDFPQAKHWLEQHRTLLLSLSYGVQLPEHPQNRPYAFIDAAGRRSQDVTLYHFAPPETVPDKDAANDILNQRWTEHWTAHYLLTEREVNSVTLAVWEVLGEPKDVQPIEYPWRRLKTKDKRVSAAYDRFKTGDTRPQPGFVCRDCPVFDVCREGQR